MKGIALLQHMLLLNLSSLGLLQLANLVYVHSSIESGSGQPDHVLSGLKIIRV